MTEPSGWVVRFGGLVRSGGPVLDVAAGKGRNARWFAARGHPVVCVDRDADALAETAGVGIETVVLDLEQRPGVLLERFGPASMAAVVVCNYLHRPLLPDLVALLEEGGVLLYETFAQGNERFGRPRRPEFLLRPSELLDECDVEVVEREVVDRTNELALGAGRAARGARGALRVVAFEQGRTGEGDDTRVRQRLCAVAGPRPLDQLPLDAAPPGRAP